MCLRYVLRMQAHVKKQKLRDYLKCIALKNYKENAKLNLIGNI